MIRQPARVETVCPPELARPAPAPVPPPADGSRISGTPEGLGFVKDHFVREGALDALLADARKACPAPAARAATPF